MWFASWVSGVMRGRGWLGSSMGAWGCQCWSFSLIWVLGLVLVI
jgi:hypothetical protein